MPKYNTKPRVEFEPSREVWALLDRLADRWPGQSRAYVIERALFIAEDALLHAETHPAWTPPELGGKRSEWRSRASYKLRDNRADC
jgi:hypothetical protein